MNDSINSPPSSGEEFIGRTFETGDWGARLIDKVTFENCEFVDFGLEKTEFFDCTFLDCCFRRCRMNMAHVQSSGFQNAKFEGSRLQGVDWSLVAKGTGFMDVVFEDCALEYGSFAGMKCRGTIFRRCRLTEADFSEADVRSVDFQGSDLEGAVFQRTDLSSADFSEAMNYVFDPSQNKVKDARFSIPGAEELLRGFGVKIV